MLQNANQLESTNKGEEVEMHTDKMLTKLGYLEIDIYTDKT